MSFLVMPARSTAAAVTGMSISTSLPVVSARMWSLWAKEMMATSRMFEVSPPVLARLRHVGVGLAVRLEVADALECRADLVVVDPHGLDPHADVHIGNVDFLQQVHQGQIGAVELDESARVRHLHGLAVELHVHDAERRERALVRQLDLLGGRHAVGGARPARRYVDLAALRALLAEDLLLGDAGQEPR